MLHATYIFDGFTDYWCGDCDRWDENKGCLFANYGPHTTVRDLVDGWVEDFFTGGDCDTLPESVTDGDVRAALLRMLSPQGLAEYESGALAECAEWIDADDYDEEQESPVAIVLLECDVCPECREQSGDDTVDGLCNGCYDKEFE